MKERAIELLKILRGQDAAQAPVTLERELCAVRDEALEALGR
jgi:hypothetical protein